MNEEEKEFNDIQLSAFLTKEEMLQAYRKLQQENQQLKEEIILLKASEPMLELTKYYGERDLYKSIFNEVRKLVTDYEEIEKIIGAGKPMFPLYKLQKIIHEVGGK